MKTYLKGMKTVAIIFLSIVLFSCQDEQIELQDTLSTESNEHFSKPGKGNGGNGNVVYFNVEIVDTFTETGDNILYTDQIGIPEDCVATNNSKQTVVWFDNGCDNLFTTTEGIELKLSFISMGQEPIDEIQVWMQDADENEYRTLVMDTDGESPGAIIPPVDILPEGYIVAFNESLTIYKKVGKGKNRHLEPSGEIRLGEIVMEPID